MAVDPSGLVGENMNGRKQSLRKRVVSQTVWVATPVTLDDIRIVLDLKKYVFPIYDMVIILAGIMALRGGMPSLATIYNETISTIASYVLLSSAVSCLIGIAFPRLRMLEAFSKIVLTTVLVIYGGALLGLSVANPVYGFTGTICVAACVLPAAGIYWIGRDYPKWSSKRAAG